jgi:hypothetical protein
MAPAEMQCPKTTAHKGHPWVPANGEKPVWCPGK